MVDADQLADLLATAIETSMAPLVARIAALEKRQPVHGRDGRDGKDGASVTVTDVAPLITKAVTDIQNELRPFVVDELRKAIDAMPIPERGEPGPPGPVGPAGDKGDTGPIGPQGPQGERGADGAIGPQGPQGDAGVDGRDGRDGQPGAPGPAGEKGLDGKDGRDGIDGKDGQDGLGFDDVYEVLEDGGRVIVKSYRNGDRQKVIRHKTVQTVYRGIWEDAKAYDPGDQVTWGGSMWIALMESTSVRPEADTATGRKHWQLCVLRGREGKRGEKGDIGAPGPRGEKGDPGRGHY